MIGTDGGALHAWSPTDDPRGTAATELGSYEGGVNMVIRTEDGYLTGGNDGAVMAWPDGAAGTDPREVARSDGAIYRIRVSPDGRRVLTSGDAGVFLHDLTSGTTRTIGTGLFFDVAFDAEPGIVLTTAPDGRLLRWRPGAAAGEQVPISGTAQVMGTSPDGRRLGVGTGQGLVVLALGPEPRVEFSKAFDGGVNGVAFGPGGLIATAGGDGSVRVLSTTGDVLSRMTGHEGPVADVTFLSRDRVVSTGVDGSTRAWAWAEGREPHLPGAPLAAVGGVLFIGDDIGIVAADGSKRLWSPPAPAARAVLSAMAEEVSAGALSDDGRLLATAATDGTLVVRDADGRDVGTWPLGNLVSQLTWSPDGGTVAAALVGGDVAAVDVASGATTPRVLGSHAEDATTVAVHPVQRDHRQWRPGWRRPAVGRHARGPSRGGPRRTDQRARLQS